MIFVQKLGYYAPKENKTMVTQITIPVPSLPADWHSTAVGIIGAAATLVQQYTKTGSVNLETVGVAVLIAVVCWFIPAKPGATDQAAMVQTVEGIVNSVVGSKLPAIVAQQMAVNPLVQSGVDAVVAVTAQAEVLPAN